MYSRKYLYKKSSGFVATLLLAVGAGLWLVTAQAAGNASFSLSPASGSHHINTNFTTTIYENSGGEAVNAVEANLIYDASKLQFVSLSTGGSPFTSCVQTTGGGGSVTISCALLGSSVSGNQTVGSVTFKALAGSGSTAVTFRSDSKVLRSSDNADIWNGNTAGGNYSLTTPAAPAAPPAGGSGSTSSNTGTVTSTTTKPSATKPAAGSSTSSGTSASSGAATGTDAAAQQADPASPVAVSNTAAEQSGYLVAIKALDKEGKIMVGATVTLLNHTATSDSTGIASFVGVPAGKHEVKVKSKAGTVASKIAVAGNKSPAEVQEFTVKLKAEGGIPFIVIIPTVLTLLLAAAAAFAYKTGLLRQLLAKIHPAAPLQAQAPAATTAVAAPSPLQTPPQPSAPGTPAAPSPPPPDLEQPAPTIIRPTRTIF